MCLFLVDIRNGPGRYSQMTISMPGSPVALFGARSILSWDKVIASWTPFSISVVIRNRFVGPRKLHFAWDIHQKSAVWTMVGFHMASLESCSLYEAFMKNQLFGQRLGSTWRAPKNLSFLTSYWSMTGRYWKMEPVDIGKKNRYWTQRVENVSWSLWNRPY